MIKNEKGVTLVALVIMIIVITILATVATYTGLSTISDMRVTAFVKRMETVEERVKTLVKKAEVDSELKNKLGLSDDTDTTNMYGDDATTSSYVSGSLANEIGDLEGYRYFSEEDLKEQLDISDIDGTYVINFKTKKVFSVEGVEYNSKTVYSVSDVKD